MSRMCEMANGTMQEYKTCAETATALRVALRDAFPGVKFSVVSKTYSGGASIRVRWAVGPRADAVKAITRPFEGADFDGMQDLKTYRTAFVNGQRVHWGADFIFTEHEGTRCACGHVDDQHDDNPAIGCRAEELQGWPRERCKCQRFEARS